MRQLTTLLLSGCLVLAGCGGEQPPAGSASTETTEEAPSAPTAPPTTPDAAAPPSSAQQPVEPEVGPGSDEGDGTAAVEKLIGEMVRAYQAAPTMTDRIVDEFTMAGQNPPPQEHFVSLGRGLDVRITSPGQELTAVHGFVYVTVSKSPDRFIKLDMVGDILTTCRQEFGRPAGHGGLHCALRAGKPMDEIIEAMGFGMSQTPRISGYHAITDSQGEPIEQITLVTGSGHAVVNVDPATKFVTKIELEDSPSGAPPGFVMSRRLTFQPEVHEELPEPITFDEGDRLRVRTIRELHGMAPKERVAAELKIPTGQPAPDFTLYTLKGEKVVLSELRGSVVVLEFWATWCVDCRKGLPLLQEFVDWAEGSGRPIKVYAIAGAERAESGENMWEQAHDYWDRLGFAMPSLIDETGQVNRSFGVLFLPATVIIDQQGRIFSAEMGPDPNLVPSLQARTAEALRAGG